MMSSLVCRLERSIERRRQVEQHKETTFLVIHGTKHISDPVVSTVVFLVG